MRRLFGNCPFCQKPSVFELVTITNQRENRALGYSQCLECCETVLISFEVSDNDYKKIEALGRSIEDGDSSPKASAPSIIDF